MHDVGYMTAAVYVFNANSRFLIDNSEYSVSCLKNKGVRLKHPAYHRQLVKQQFVSFHAQQGNGSWEFDENVHIHRLVVYRLGKYWMWLNLYFSLRLLMGVTIYGVEKSAKPEHNLREIEGLVARLDALPYDDKAAIHTG